MVHSPPPHHSEPSVGFVVTQPSSGVLFSPPPPLKVQLLCSSGIGKINLFSSLLKNLAVGKCGRPYDLKACFSPQHIVFLYAYSVCEVTAFLPIFKIQQKNMTTPQESYFESDYFGILSHFS